MRFLDVKGLAAYLDISLRTAYELCDKGRIPAVKIGGQWRIRISDIEALFDRAAKGER